MVKGHINDNDDELESIRAKKLEEMRKNYLNNSKSLGDDMPSEPLIITEQNFEEVIKENPLVVIDCWAPWCGPCRTVAPVIEELAKEYEGKILFGKLNTDENQGIAMKYNIMSIPTFLIFKNGELIDRPVGAIPKPALESAITKHLD